MKALIELLDGQGAHASTLACVEDVSCDLAHRRVSNFPHSIWQLVYHMNYWMNYELQRIRREKPNYPAHASQSWPADTPLLPEDEWRETVARFRELLNEVAKLAEAPADILGADIDATHPVHAKDSSSLLSVLWQIVVHNSYHVGQLVVLRRALGAWPPKRGGDSW